MDRVLDVAGGRIDVSSYAAIVIGEPSQDQRHIGILYRAGANAAPNVLHLAGHCDLRDETSIPSYFTLCVEPQFHATRLRQLAAYCRRVWYKNAAGGIPYALSPPHEALDAATGAFLLGPSRFGLTCASFVLAVFEAARLPLLACETWIADRPGDREWQQAILELLAPHAEPSHVEFVRAEIGAVRYRPEEVAASAVLAPPPTNFEQAAGLAMQILARLRR